MKNGKQLIASVCFILSIIACQSAFAGFGSIFDLFFNTTQSAVYYDGSPSKKVDTSYLYEKFSDYYCVEAFGQELCGYDCRIGDTHSECAQTREQNCVKNDYGMVTCGYDCQVSGHDMRCATEYGHNCIKDGLGKITCGDNCQCVHGVTRCDSVEHFDDYHNTQEIGPQYHAYQPPMEAGGAHYPPYYRDGYK